MSAVLWDVDGTLAETERDGHLVALNRAFEEFDVAWRWSERRYRQLLRIAGGVERLTHALGAEPTAPRDADERANLVRDIHRRKNEIYVQLVESGAVCLRPGVRDLMEDCRSANVAMAIVTTTSRGNAEALLRANLGEDWRGRFATVVAAEDAPRKKPDPQAYRVALDRLGVPAEQVLAIEDSPAGLESARALGITVIVTRSCFFDDDPVPGALAVGPSLGTREGWTPESAGTGRVGLAELRRWHETNLLATTKSG